MKQLRTEGVSSPSSQMARKGNFGSMYVNRAQQEYRNVFSHEDKSCPPSPRCQRERGDHPLCPRTAGVLGATGKIASKPERSLLLKISPMIDEKRLTCDGASLNCAFQFCYKFSRMCIWIGCKDCAVFLIRSTLSQDCL